jgi:hypothetical protein
MRDAEWLDDHPDAYERLTAMAQEALHVWIRHALAPASPQNTTWSSSFLKREFEAVGFALTNGEFKGAMLTAGYEPKKRSDSPDWYFAVKTRTVGSAQMKRPAILGPGKTFPLTHLTMEERDAFDALAALAHNHIRKHALPIQASPAPLDPGT